MNKFTGVGPYFYAAAVACFGVIQLVTQHFLTGLLPVPDFVPLRWWWMILTSGLFILAAAAFFFRYRRQLAVLVMGAVFTIYLLALHLPLLIAHIYVAEHWSATFEVVMLASGAFIIAAQLPDDAPGVRGGVIARLALVSHYLFAVSLFLFAIQHIMYNDYIITLIPAWLPVPTLLAYLVIAAYLLSGVSFVIGQRVGLAAFWLGVMFGMWVLLLHAPRAIGKWNVEAEWTSLFVALAVCGVAFSISRRESADDLTGIIVLPRA
jgi:hypothetical protein